MPFAVYSLTGARRSSTFGLLFARKSAAIARVIQRAIDQGLPCSKVDDDTFMIGDPKDGYADLYVIEECEAGVHHVEG